MSGDADLIPDVQHRNLPGPRQVVGAVAADAQESAEFRDRQDGLELLVRIKSIHICPPNYSFNAKQ